MSSTTFVDSILPLRILICAKVSKIKEVANAISVAVKSINPKIYLILYFMDQQTLESVKKYITNIELSLANYDDPPIDYVITFGGDGTILYSAKIFKKHQPIFLTFQMGTLGFLCKFNLSQLNQVLYDAISARNLSEQDQFPFSISKMIRLQGQVKNKITNTEHKSMCLNQIAITRDFKSRIILQLYVNNQFLTETGGDGILIATPTGSTAYSLSAGGPVVQNGVNCIIIVPIAPHSLSFRPLCLHLSSIIKIKLSQKSQSSGYISFDGQTNNVFSEGDEVIIKRGNNFITFYEPKQENCELPNWRNRLRIFLNWNQPFKSGENAKQRQDVLKNNLIDVSKPKL